MTFLWQSEHVDRGDVVLSSPTGGEGSEAQPVQFSYVVRMPSTSVSPVDMSSAATGIDSSTSSSANMSSRRMSEDKSRKDRFVLACIKHQAFFPSPPANEHNMFPGKLQHIVRFIQAYQS